MILLNMTILHRVAEWINLFPTGVVGLGCHLGEPEFIKIECFLLSQRRDVGGAVPYMGLYR